MSENSILIVSGGSIEDVFVLELLDKNNYGTVIACDSAIEFFRKNGRLPDLVLGDFDSAGRDTVEFFREQADVCFEQFSAEKDWTETASTICSETFSFWPLRLQRVCGCFFWMHTTGYGCLHRGAIRSQKTGSTAILYRFSPLGVLHMA